MVYANLKPIRTATHWDRCPVARALEFQAFIEATGIVPERDLDAVAVALHRRSDPAGPNGPVAYSEVFEGRFDADRLTHYLGTIARGRESYVGQTIFAIPMENTPGGRLLRVAVLGRERVAASNAPEPEQIHAMLDRVRGGAGASLLTARYSEVPWFASAWGLGRLGLPFAENGFLALGGLRLPLSDETEFLASVRYSGAVQLRVEALAGSGLDAARTAQELSSLLTLARAVAENQPGWQNSPARSMVDSLALTAKGDRVLLTGTMPIDLLRQLTSAPSQAPR